MTAGMIPPIAGPWILAQMNVSRLREPIDAPRLLPFVERIAAVNALADAAPGFLWREEDGTGPGNLGHRPFGDEVIYNLSLWRDVESLAAFTYGPEHRVVMQDRDDWFLPAAGVTYVLWWVPADSDMFGIASTVSSSAAQEHTSWQTCQRRRRTPQTVVASHCWCLLLVLQAALEHIDSTSKVH